MLENKTIIQLSIILPCYNEAENIKECHVQLTDVLLSIGITYEFIFVDDGSTDATLLQLKELAANDPHVRYISFSRNYGHQKALLAGLSSANGIISITMDCDLQHPPSVIPAMLQCWKEGYDVVNTIRIDSMETTLFKKITSFIFYHVWNFFSGMNMRPGMADFRLMTRQVTDVLCKYNEHDIFLRGIVNQCGFRQTVIPYQAKNRYAGETHYTNSKMFSLAFDGIISFTIRPLRIAILFAMIFICLCIIEIGYICHVAFFTDRSVSGWASLALLITILGSATLLMLGIIAEYIGRMFMQMKHRPIYIIKETNIKETTQDYTNE